MQSPQEITGGGMAHGTGTHQQQQHTAHSQTAAYSNPPSAPPSATNTYQQQYGLSYNSAPPAPTQSYGNTVQSAYPSVPQHPSRPTMSSSSYLPGGETVTGYPQVPPTSTAQVSVMTPHNQSGASVPPMHQQQYTAPPPPTQYAAVVPPSMPQPYNRPPGPPPGAGGVGASNPYSRSAVPAPPPQVQTYRPQM